MKKTLGEVLATRRKQLGITQLELAEELNVCKSTISRIEVTKNININPWLLKKLSKRLNLDYNYLLAMAGVIEDQPEIRYIQRGFEHLTREEKNKMLLMLRYNFPQAFGSRSGVQERGKKNE